MLTEESAAKPEERELERAMHHSPPLGKDSIIDGKLCGGTEDSSSVSGNNAPRRTLDRGCTNMRFALKRRKEMNWKNERNVDDDLELHPSPNHAPHPNAPHPNLFFNHKHEGTDKPMVFKLLIRSR
nr:hypothetical protein [Tanacetum cinerariifolium]